jgi:hypothetical protein
VVLGLVIATSSVTISTIDVILCYTMCWKAKNIKLWNYIYLYHYCKNIPQKVHDMRKNTEVG